MQPIPNSTCSWGQERKRVDYKQGQRLRWNYVGDSEERFPLSRQIRVEGRLILGASMQGINQ